jgi:hypothetical protein
MRELQIETVGKPLELLHGTPVNPAGSWKGRPMWIYDGEQWIEEGASESETKPERTPQQEEMFYPELQVIEIVPVPRTNYVPPFPAV